MRWAKSRILPAVVGLVLSAALARPAAAGPIYLSDFLGGDSGSAVTISNAPYTTIITQAASGGFGVDTAGAFSSGQLIDFIGTDPFDKGIGAHPVSSIEFHLDAFRSIGSFGQFEAVIGIDPVAGGANGARFIVTLDDVEVFQMDIQSTTWGGTPILVPIPIDATTLRLETMRITDDGGNHAAWADAKLTIPEPGTLVLVLVGVVCVLMRGRGSESSAR